MTGEELNNNELSALVSLLEDDDREVLHHVQDKIISLGSGIIPFLEDKWENSFNPSLQKRIEELIHTLQFTEVKQRLLQWKSSEEQDLLEGLWAIATYSYPDLLLSDLRKEIEQIYYETWMQFKDDAHPLDLVKIINSVIFSKLRFSPNTKNFHSPGNSMINVVLETKKGNPISLCAVYLLISQKLKMPIFGVNLPNLFILTYKKGDVQFYINAFNRGIIFSREDIDQYISQLQIQPEEKFYQPCSNFDLISRSLRNLSMSFEKLGELTKKEEINELISLLSDNE